MPRRVSSPSFIGRETELAELLAALGSAERGTPAAVLLSGESGIGKTRLVAEFVARARAAGARVLEGDCLDLGEGELPYAPIIGALRGVEEERDDTALDALLGGGDAPVVAQPRLFEALLTLLRRLGEAHPVALVVEDLQWADRSTRDFLAFLVRNARTEPLALVATYRSDELHRRHPLKPFLTELGRAPSVTRVEVPPFTRDELTAQAEAILGVPPDPALVDELYERGEGNAFFTEELVAAKEASSGLPNSLRDALMLRVEALPAAAQEVLRVAAVAGREVDHRLLALTAKLPEAELVDALREAVARNILVHDARAGTYGFRHALLREALEDDLLPGERAPLHARIAAALEADPSLSISGATTAAELAFHWTLAHDAPRAYAASVRAADEARRVSAYAEAHAHDERALEFLARVPGAPADVELLRRAADTAQQAGDLPRAMALARQAIGLTDDPVLQAALHARLGRALWVAGEADLAQETLERGVALLPADAPPADRARVLGALGHVLMLRMRNDEAEPLLREALAFAERAAAPLEQARIVISLGVAAAAEPAERDRLFLTGRRIASGIGALDEVLRSYINRSDFLDGQGLVEEAIADALEGWRLAEREGMAIEASLLASEAILRLTRLGRWDEAAAVLAEAEPRVSDGLPGGALLQAGAELSALRGEAAAAARRADRASRLLAGAVGPMWAAPLAVTLATVALWAGRPQEAAEAVSGTLALLGDERDPAAVRYLAPLLAIGAQAEADVAERARGLGDAAAERAARDRLQALADRLTAFAGDPSPEVRAFVAMGAAEARRDSADAWAEVAEAWAALPRPFFAAYARWREASAALDAGGGRSQAEAALREAVATAQALGAVPLLGEVKALARRARISVEITVEEAAPETPATRVGLTPREHEVLRLLAEGRTNREIGQTLYMSEKTASVHVSRILGKLDARGRVEAATLAQRLGLLEADVDAVG